MQPHRGMYVWRSGLLHCDVNPLALAAPSATAASRPARPRVGTWYLRWGKRSADVVGVCLLAPLAAPLLLVAWLSVLLDGGEPVYRQRRIGRELRPFMMLKLRTMRPPPHAEGPWPPVTRLGDERITPLGRVLRRTKLDELPQLWNVITGDMGIVGPRPEVPACAEGRMDAFRTALVVRPGLTGLTTLVFSDEERRLAVYDDPLAGYRRDLLPQKLALDALYARHACWRLDVRIAALTGLALFAPETARVQAVRLAQQLSVPSRSGER